MPQVSELDPITVFGDPNAAVFGDPNNVAVSDPKNTSTRTSSISRIASPTTQKTFPWWRLAFGLMVIAIWIASAMQASGAAISLSATSAKNASNTWDITINYNAVDIGDASLRLYVGGKRSAALPNTSGQYVIGGVGDGVYALLVKTERARQGNFAKSNEVRLALGVSPPIVVSEKKRDAARLLMQATFGARSMDDINAVEAKGNAAWIEEQFAKPWTSHKVYIDRIKAAGEEEKEEHVYESYWQQLIWGDARLRARVALALSEIMVISNIAPDQKNAAMISWMDMLYRNAFANYRDLLQEVTLHPAMGYYLNMLGNDKEDLATGRMPNENYAREVLQLFSIGLTELNMDGTPKRDASGKTIPTYDQSVVQGFAAAFTGWNFAGNDITKSDTFHSPQENWTDFMRAWPSRHSTGAKKLLNGAALAAGQTPERDLADALDNIANHPNVAPFMSK
ncbi:MAG: DUF1800 family protein, partial [Casimicrobium sp.]